MLSLSSVSLAALGASLLGVVHANVIPDGTVKSPAARSVGPQPGCPSAIGLTNGGFETGKIAPWTLLTNSNPTDKQHIVSPGYKNSKHALQADFVAASLTEYSLAQSTTGKECFGYYYKISYAWNWINYTGPEGPGSDGTGYCAFSVITGYSSTGPQHYATRKAGWHHHSYISRDIYSHCKPLYSDYIADVTCVGVNNTQLIPAFSIQIDDFNITNAPGNPNSPPAPTGSC